MIGNTPAAKGAAQSFEFTMDHTIGPLNASTSDTSPPTYVQWFQSPTLDAGSHLIELDSLQELTLDYMVITPGPDTPLSDKTLMIDDTYPGIEYTGSWKIVNDRMFTGPSVSPSSVLAPGWPFQNGTHQTSEIGDTLQFSYTGKLGRWFKKKLDGILK